MKTEDVFDDYLVSNYRDRKGEAFQPMYPQIDHTMNDENEPLEEPNGPGPNCRNCDNVVDQQSLKCPCNLLKRDLWTGYFTQSYKVDRVTYSDSESEDLEKILESDSDDAAYFSDADQSEESNRESVLQSDCGMSPEMLDRETVNTGYQWCD